MEEKRKAKSQALLCAVDLIAAGFCAAMMQLAGMNLNGPLSIFCIILITFTPFYFAYGLYLPNAKGKKLSKSLEYGVGFTILFAIMAFCFLLFSFFLPKPGQGLDMKVFFWTLGWILSMPSGLLALFFVYRSLKN